MSQNLVLILQLDLEHGIGQGFHDHCHYLNRVFLRQTLIRFRQTSIGLACCTG
jgi:hypothetical protein